MSTQNLRNISLKDFERFLVKEGCKCIRERGGHKMWARKDFLRPLVLQSHIDPIPEFIVRNCLRNLGMTKEEFLKKWNS